MFEQRLLSSQLQYDSTVNLSTQTGRAEYWDFTARGAETWRILRHDSSKRGFSIGGRAAVRIQLDLNMACGNEVLAPPKGLLLLACVPTDNSISRIGRPYVGDNPI